MAAATSAAAVLVFHDVSESRELNRKLSYHASHDLLTGLVNRREFESRVERCLKSAKAQEAFLRAVPPRHRPVQDRSTTPAATPQATRCWGRSARCSSPRSAGATRCRASAATNSACCWRAARSKRRCARPRCCARRCATSASSGKSACSSSAPASAWCRSRRTTRTSRRSCRRPTAPARPRRSRAATACTASTKTTSS